MSSKVQRQQAISKLVMKHAVSNQPQLVELLAVEGIAATQATVSRDLEDLGAVKVRVPGGETVYAIPEFEPARLAQYRLHRLETVSPGLAVLPANRHRASRSWTLGP